jgi:hypothetical protein
MGILARRDIDIRVLRIGQKVKFQFLKQKNEPIELIGSFYYNVKELRWEISVLNNIDYIYLPYIKGGIEMYDFEFIF